MSWVGLGGQTVTFVMHEEKGRDALGVPRHKERPVAVRGCRHRPLNGTEKADLLGAGSQNLATEVFKTTAPKEAALLDVSAIDHLEVLDARGEVVRSEIIAGTQVFPDVTGEPYKVTIFSKKVSL